MKPITTQAEPEIKSEIWDFKYKKAQEQIKESFWGDFLFGGLLVSGIFIIVDNLNLPQEVSLIIGVINICLALLLMVGRLEWPKIIHFRINKMMAKAKILYRFKLYNKSIHYLDKIIKIDSKIKKVCLIKGSSLDNLGREEEAIECYDKAIEIDPKYKEAWYNKGIALHNLGRQEEEIECYNKALEIDPDFVLPIYNKACLESLRDNKQESINYLKKVIELDESMIKKAKLEADFDNIRDSEEFKKLIG